MRHLTSLLLAGLLGLFMLPPAAQAQEVDLGVQGGLLLNSVSASDNDFGESSIGGTGGAFLRLGFRKFSVQPEAMLTYKGYDATIQIPNPSLGIVEEVDVEERLLTFDVPVLAGYQLLDLKLLKLYAQAGPYASIVLNESSDIADNFANLPNDEDEIYNSVNIGIQAGVALDITKFTIALRYDGTLGDLADEDISSNPIDGDDNVRFNAFRLMVGFKFL